MRAPRYRFPDEVRSTTRIIASRMVDGGTTARTPEELDAWISGAPDLRATLQRGGYGSAFTAHDLFPLLEVFVAKAGGSPSRVEAPTRSAKVLWWGFLLVLLVALLLAFAAGVFS